MTKSRVVISTKIKRTREIIDPKTGEVIKIIEK
jgi:hypothetical protein